MAHIESILLGCCSLNKIRQVYLYSWTFTYPNVLQMVLEPMVRRTFEWILIILRDVVHELKLKVERSGVILKGFQFGHKKTSIEVEQFGATLNEYFGH